MKEVYQRRLSIRIILKLKHYYEGFVHFIEIAIMKLLSGRKSKGGIKPIIERGLEVSQQHLIQNAHSKPVHRSASLQTHARPTSLVPITPELSQLHLGIVNESGHKQLRLTFHSLLSISIGKINIWFISTDCIMQPRKQNLDRQCIRYQCITTLHAVANAIQCSIR